jgi:hypothetical protein
MTFDLIFVLSVLSKIVAVAVNFKEFHNRPSANVEKYTNVQNRSEGGRGGGGEPANRRNLLWIMLQMCMQNVRETRRSVSTGLLPLIFHLLN